MTTVFSTIELLESKCVGCGNTFIPANARQSRCSHDCGRKTHNSARSVQRENHVTRFIGVDGEGVGQGRNHAYCLLSVGDQSLYHADGSQLHFLEIFEFLWKQFLADPHAAYVGYYLSYDFTQWLRTLPGERARMLLTSEGIAKRRRKSGSNPVPFPVDYQKLWEFDLLAFKRFKLRKYGAKEWMYICDAGPFFQMPFLQAISEDWITPIVSDEDLQTIVRGKSRRNVAKFDAEMIHYNVTENRVMSRLMSEYNAGLVSVDIKLQNDQWFGPGQAAQAWLDNIGAPTGKLVRETVPPEYLDAAQRSFYGGWFEITVHGPIPGKVYEYDINSAYPAVIATLPCLLHGQYSSGKGDIKFDKTTFTIVHAATESKSKFLAAMPYRHTTGEIFRPLQVSGWYWQHEIEMAKRAGLISEVEIDEWVRYKPCKCPPPMRDIRNLYNQRLIVGKKTPQGRAYKIVYNSAYGKNAQSVGNPKYANAVYASLITAGCRTRILEAIATHPRKAADVVMIATDGIYFLSEHPKLKIDPEALGAWSMEEKRDITLFKPGMYWDDEARQNIAEGKTPKLKSRGISASDLANVIDQIDSQWDWHPAERRIVDGKKVLIEWKWPAMHIPVNFDMITAKQALMRGAWHEAGVTIHDGERVHTSSPHNKRDIHSIKLVDGLLRSRPRDLEFPVESTPYEGRFGEEMRDEIEDSAVTTPDGDAMLFAVQALTRN